MLKLLFQFFKFGIVGLVNTLSSLAIYYVLVFAHVNYMIATTTGYFLSSIIGFFLNKIWVFQAKKAETKETTIKYYIVYGCALLINVSLMYLQVDILQISDKVAPILTLFVTVPFNFVMSKFWVFKEK